MSTALDKYEKYADLPTPKPMEGRWRLVRPDGFVYEGDTPMDCIREEVLTRVPPHVALGRIARSLNEMDDAS